MENKALFIRTCDKNLQGHGGFQWPESGSVTAPDWKPTEECGFGLHGLKWGKGDWSLLSKASDTKWLVFEADENLAVDIDGQKHKVQTANVVYCGNSKGAITFLLNYLLKQKSTEITSTTDRSAHANTAGYSAHANTAGNYAHASTKGEDSVSACLGYDGRAKASKGVLVMAWHDGNRRRISVGYVGEDIESDQWYKVGKKGQFIKCKV